ncbi:ferrichrome ABC transporter ATP-binding protein [Haloarcula mannanilytica]|uniref:Cobalamin import ATP-binding protein BtuD n=1 Tax=Haloarcula mannanilytica TaxID=2509225 RepID=A0A4C2EVG4_9EURY|nr:ABC transporter ATP-binding protein [Haloarcula mannanilytica]GCF16209.1 ferrichrome ABC transporter ATP-binding protein [Haloarcula mannanilytica]
MAQSIDDHDTDAVNSPETTEDSETDIVVSAEDLSLAYPSSDDIVVACDDLRIPRGQITALIGPNGSGKSTLLKALSNHLQPHSGTVSLEGRTVQEYDRKEFARKLSRLSQENDSPGDITVEDLVLHGRYPYRGFFDGVSEEDEDAVERAIELAGVEHLRESSVQDLSGGQKQLVWTAVVLAQETDVLLLDEPTTFLDLKHQLQVMETIHRLNEQRAITIVVVLHDIEQAAHNADHLFALKDGAIEARGEPADVVTEGFLKDIFEIEADVQSEPSLRIHPQRPAQDE